VAERALKFAVVREDPNLEAELVQRVSAKSALVVASGGCTALTLVHRFPALRVTAFDLHPGALAHLQAKRDAVRRQDLAALNVQDTSAAGLNQKGEFEGLFRVLRHFIEEFVAPQSAITRVLDEATPSAERLAEARRWFTSRYWPVAFSTAFHEPFLNAMFGPAATQHAEKGSYPAYFQRAFERGLLREDAPRNPFLHHVLRGAYGGSAVPDYIHAARDLPVTLVQGSLLEVPDLDQFDLFSLSNVFDWSEDELVDAWARALRAKARPGSAVLIRKLNNERDVRRFFGADFVWDDALGTDFVGRDRSLFYSRIEVAFRRDGA
jgi:S-adenosylmethionine-diacylglycerol 3-amino-3-carboxypropyl transferase